MKRLTLPSVSRNNNISDIVQGLKELHDRLSTISQDEFEGFQEELKPIATGLVNVTLLKHNDKAIKLLVSCCISNILRLFAPDAPYTPNQLKDIFTLIVQQLKGLGDEKNPYQSYVFYLLESLATVKSIILLLDIDDSNGERERLLQQLFTLLFDLAPLPWLTKPAKLYLLEIAQTLLEECDNPSPEVIRLLIFRCNDVRQETKSMAHELIKLTSIKLQPLFGLYFNESLMSWSVKEEIHKRLEPLKELHSQMVTLGTISPIAISSILSQMEDELQATDTEIRIISINSLARLFAGSNSVENEIVKLYPQIWQSWLNKMNDRSTSVRVLWTKLALDLLSNSNITMRGTLQKCLCEKMMDMDSKVREKIMLLFPKWLEINGNSPSLLGSNLIEEIGNRCRDKSEDVRLPAMETLCEIIRRLYHSIDQNYLLFSESVNILWKLIYTNDRDLRIFFEYFIEHSFMTPRSIQNLEEHASLLLQSFKVMNEESRKAFKKWLHDKSMFVRYFSAFCHLSISGKTADDPRLATLIQHLSNLFRVPVDAIAALKELPMIIRNNEHVRDGLVALGSAETLISRMSKLVEWAVETSWSQLDARLKTYLMTFLARRASLLSINNSIITAILTLKDDYSKNLVEEIVCEFPFLGLQHAELLEELIISDPENSEHLAAYSRFVTACSDKVSVKDNFIDRLFNYLTDETNAKRKNVKYATRILINLRQKDRLVELIETVIQSKTLKSKNDWQILCEIANNSEYFDTLNLENFIADIDGFLDRLKITEVYYKSVTCLDNCDDFESCTILAIRCVRNMFLAMKNLDKELEMEKLRIFAPTLVSWLEKCVSPSVKMTSVKTLMILIPRPTSLTILNNMSILLLVMKDEIIHNKFDLTISRLYHQGNIGMIYLILPILAERMPFINHIGEIRRNDRLSQSILPFEDSAMEINSQSIRRYEDLFIVYLMMVAAISTPSSINEEVIDNLTMIINRFVEVISTEMNISHLFDASVQLKRHVFTIANQESNRVLYIISELAQTALRNRATHCRWSLQSVRNPIIITDDLLKEITSTEELCRIVKKSYLLAFNRAPKIRSVQKPDLIEVENLKTDTNSIDEEIKTSRSTLKKLKHENSMESSPRKMEI